MKKFFMIAVMAVAAISASAQTWAGGSLGFSTKHNNGADKNVKAFNINPEVGYSLNDKFDVAIALGYEHFDGKTNAYSIKPYVRYTFAKEGNFSAFVDGGLNYTTKHTNGVENNENSFGAFVAPGIAYGVSSKVTLVAHLGDGLTFDHNWTKDVARSNKLALDLFNGVSFGAYYNF